MIFQIVFHCTRELLAIHDILRTTTVCVAWCMLWKWAWLILYTQPDLKHYTQEMTQWNLDSNGPGRGGGVAYDVFFHICNTLLSSFNIPIIDDWEAVQATNQPNGGRRYLMHAQCATNDDMPGIPIEPIRNNSEASLVPNFGGIVCDLLVVVFIILDHSPYQMKPDKI